MLWKRSQRGFTLLEMLTVATVLVILASAVIPMVKNGITRQQEIELRRNLREMRTAIDNYKAMADQQKITAPPVANNGYPESLEVLVEGVSLTGKTTKIRFLRRIPVDPFTGKPQWGLRSAQDESDSTSWGGGSVFDVYSLSDRKGMNGIPYKEW
ncbi:type II secretion system protein [Holophaga foetida]|uniref:type II secretion system protein n=1 Tax=Holophaga foetida TaxID=35839 RepID=UPI0002472F52|nr:type II secretion system protein [Holophaga foetida]